MDEITKAYEAMRAAQEAEYNEVKRLMETLGEMPVGDKLLELVREAKQAVDAYYGTLIRVYVQRRFDDEHKKN